MIRKKANKIVDLLYEMHPDAVCELEFSSVYQLLVATVLSAQTTDKKVNDVTKDLFKVAPTPYEMVKMNKTEIKEHIKTIGLSKSKAGYLYDLSEKLINEFDGKVPTSMEELTSLSGVGRKTANVVRSVGFNIPSMAVDTHVKRLSNRIGFSKSDNVNHIEEDLKKAIPKYRWIIAHHLLIFHGRRVCKARKPLCNDCLLTDLCKYYKEQNG